MQSPRNRPPIWIVAAFLAMGGVFLLDARGVQGVAAPVLYVASVWLAYAWGRLRWLWIVSSLCVMLTIGGRFTHDQLANLAVDAANRLLALVAIGGATTFCYFLRIRRQKLEAEFDERRRIEDALRDSEQRARSILDTALDAVVAIDEHSRVIEWNPRAESVFGWSRDEVLGRTITDVVIPAEYRAAHRDGIARFLETGEGPVLYRRIELTALRRNGERFPVELAICPARSSAGWTFSAFLRDITERRRLEQRFRAAIEAAPIAMLMVNPGGQIVLANAEAERLFRCTRDDLLYQPIEMLVPERYRADHPALRAGFFAAPQSRRMGAGRDLWGLRRDGSEFPIEIGLNPVQTEDGVLVLCSIVDVTARQRAEETQRTLQQELERRVIQRTTELNAARERSQRSEEALRTSQERHDLALTSAGVGTWDWRIGSDVITWDDYMHPLFGIAPGAFGGRYEDFMTIVHPHDRERVHAEVERAVEINDDYDSEFRILWPDGSERLIAARGRVYRDDTGAATRMTGVCWDVTESRRIEEQLRETAAALDRVAGELALPPHQFPAADAAFRLSEFSLTDMMTCGAAIRGMSPGSNSVDELAGRVVRYLHQHIVDDDGSRALPLVRLFATATVRELDPERQSIARSFPGTDSDTLCLVLVATAGQEADWNVVERSRRHRVIPLASRAALQSLPMIPLLLRQLGLVVPGITGDDVADGDEYDASPADGAAGVFYIPEAAVSEFIPEQKEFVQGHDIRSVVGFGDVLPDGRLFAVVAFSKAPIAPDAARLLSHLSLSLKMAWQPLIDIPRKTEAQVVALDQLLRNHERIVAEQDAALRRQALALARSNAELEQFAYIASHDLQEPLRKIQAFGNLLTANFRDALGDEGKDYLDRMERAAARMQSLITDLLSLSRVMRRGQPFRPVDLNDVLAAVLVDLESRLQQTGGTVEADSLPTLDADATQMQQLLQNLVGNALKYHRPDAPPRVRVRAEPTGDDPPQWRIAISDNGIGFDPQYADRIFQPFQRLHGRGEFEGTGMGLAICRRIAQRHGGTITAVGQPGSGSTFTVTLPAAQSSEESAYVFGA